MQPYIKNKQRGMAAAISIFILLVVIGGMLMTAFVTSSSSISGSIQLRGHQQALFLAETGIQRAKYEVDKSGSCASAILAETSYANGSFAIIDSTQSGGACVVEVQGKSQKVISVWTRSIKLSGVASGSFLDEFTPDSIDFLSNWSTTYIRNSSYGATNWSMENFPASTGGSMRMSAKSVKRPKKVVAYLERTLPIVIDATAAAITFTYTFKLMTRDDTASGTAAQVQKLKLFLIDSTGANAKMKFWDSTGLGLMDNLGNWSSQGSGTKKVKKGKFYDKIQVKFWIKSQKYTNTYVFLDDIKLTW